MYWKWLQKRYGCDGFLVELEMRINDQAAPGRVPVCAGGDRNAS